MEDFIIGPNVAKIQDVGDICFNEELYQAAKILFNTTNNSAKLAICLVKLESFQEAVDAARKANQMTTWKAVCFSCVDSKKFRLAQLCALNIIVHMDHLHELILHYERNGYFDEIIKVLEQGINLERAHPGIYTQLGIMYSKYKEEKLMEHVKLFWSKITINQLLNECKASHHWPEAVFLLRHNDKADVAITTMIEHSAECWEHKLFKETIQQVSKSNVFYKAFEFYLEEHPLLLNDLLIDLVNVFTNHTSVVEMIREAKQIALIQKYLEHVQRDNIVAVNEASNEL
jgi:clathrin heavy chain